jgi:O-antigen/teichoic acid export membrane protein
MGLQVLRSILGLFLTPILLGALGRERFGLWGVLQQFVAYARLADLKPSAALKFSLAVSQASDDGLRKRQEVGAAVVVWVLSIPLLLGLGAGLSFFGVHLIELSGRSVREEFAVAAFVGVAAYGLVRLAEIPGDVLRGVNLDYRSAGVRAAGVVVESMVLAIASVAGLTLPALVVIGPAVAVASGLLLLVVVRRHVPWWGCQRPSWGVVAGFARMGGWITVLGLSGLLLDASEIALTGVLAGPLAAGVLVASGASARLAASVVSSAASAANSGLAGLCGARRWRDVARARHHLRALATIGGAVAGGLIIAFNRAFVEMWLGHDMWGGTALNVSLAIGMVAALMVRVDGAIVDGMMLFRGKAIWTFVSASLAVALAVVLHSQVGLAGIVSGFAAGRVAQGVFLCRLIDRSAGGALQLGYGPVRPMLAIVLIWPLALAADWYLAIRSWHELLVWAGSLGGLFTLGAWYVGLHAAERRLVLERVFDNRLP